MKINTAGLDIIKQFEGCRLTSYVCAGGKLTIGYGHTVDVKPGMQITQHQADIILLSDLEYFEQKVLLLTPNANENQFSALVSFAYNLGEAALGRSSLLKKFLAGDIDGASQEFGKWVMAGGKKLDGLVKRRHAEAELFLKPV